MNLLLVEDELGLSDALCHVLTEEGYRVDAVADGEEGLARALSDIYDVIVLDIMLPNRNGLEILTRLRKDKIATPLLLLTAKSELEDKVKGLDCGADDYLTKPFMTEELLARLRVITRRSGDIMNDVLIFSDLELHTRKCEICCHNTGQTVKLGAKEFQLMEILMRNQHQIISKDQLIEKIWGYENESEYNNVEVYISFVRKKIQFTGSKVKIKVTRGIGYSLEASS